MDRLYWPEPPSIPVVGPEAPWIVELRRGVGDALALALDPIVVRVCTALASAGGDKGSVPLPASVVTKLEVRRSG